MDEQLKLLLDELVILAKKYEEYCYLYCDSPEYADGYEVSKRSSADDLNDLIAKYKKE